MDDQELFDLRFVVEFDWHAAFDYGYAETLEQGIAAARGSSAKEVRIYRMGEIEFYQDTVAHIFRVIGWHIEQIDKMKKIRGKEKEIAVFESKIRMMNKAWNPFPSAIWVRGPKE